MRRLLALTVFPLLLLAGCASPTGAPPAAEPGSSVSESEPADAPAEEVAPVEDLTSDDALWEHCRLSSPPDTMVTEILTAYPDAWTANGFPAVPTDSPYICQQTFVSNPEAGTRWVIIPDSSANMPIAEQWARELADAGYGSHTIADSLKSVASGAECCSASQQFHLDPQTNTFARILATDQYLWLGIQTG